MCVRWYHRERWGWGTWIINTLNRCHITHGNTARNRKAYQSKANHPLADRCMGYIVNTFEQVQGGGRHVIFITWGTPPPPHTHTHPLWTDRHDWKHDLPALHCGQNKRLNIHDATRNQLSKPKCKRTCQFTVFLCILLLCSKFYSSKQNY